MPGSSKEFLDIQATIECQFTLKHVCDMKRKYSQMPRTDKYSQLSLIIWPTLLNGWVFVHEIGGCGFESSCGHLKYIQSNLWNNIHEMLWTKNYSKLFNLIKAENDATWSIEYWNLKQKQVPRLTLETEGHYKAYNPTLKNITFA